MNLPNFWYGSCSYGLLWKNHTLYAMKILVWQNFADFNTKIWPFSAKNWQFWEFLTCNIQTLLWIWLMFGTEVVVMFSCFYFSFSVSALFRGTNHTSSCLCVYKTITALFSSTVPKWLLSIPSHLTDSVPQTSHPVSDESECTHQQTKQCCPVFRVSI